MPTGEMTFHLYRRFPGSPSLALGQGPLRPIGEINRIIARLAKFSRAELRKIRRRIRTEPAPVGDRQAILAHISLLCGSEKPLVPTPEETLALPVAIVTLGLLAPLVRQIAEGLRRAEKELRLEEVAPIS